MESRKYFTCRVAQRDQGSSVDFVVFVAYAKDILKWSGIRRVGEHEQGTQRILKYTRVKAIQKFLNRDQRNTIPTSVIVAFLPEATKFRTLQKKLDRCFPRLDSRNGVNNKAEWGVLTFDFEEGVEEHLRPALIVDGQHRLKAIAGLEEDIPILVVALIDASPEEQAFQFVVINNKSAKVPTDNVKAIITNFDEHDLQERLADAGVNYGTVSADLREIDNREDSPYRNLLDWPLNPITLDREERKKHILVKLTAVESCLRYIRNQIPAVAELEDQETEREVFLAIWRAVASVYDDLWRKNETFMSKVNINALNEFIVDRLENAWVDNAVDIYEPEEVEDYSRNVIESIPEDFWTTKWQERLQDNAVIRNLIKDDLRKIAHNTRLPGRKAWYEGLKLIGKDV